MKRLYFFLLLGLLNVCATGQMDVKQAEAHIKTVYLYNFSKYIEWPAEYSQGSFIIGVINGGPALMAELNKMAATKTAGNQKFVVKNYQFVSDIDKCNILYVPETSNGQLQDILRKIRGYSTLLVTEYNGDAKKGATINFILKDSKQQFELNQANAEHCKLVVSNSLAALATKVD